MRLQPELSESTPAQRKRRLYAIFSTRGSLRNRSLLVYFLVHGLLLGCYRDSRRREPVATVAKVATNASPTAGYIADALCERCHADLYASYQDVGMAQSFYLPDTSNLIENFDDSHYWHPPSNQHFEMAVRDGNIFQTRYQLDAQGQRINELEVRVDAIIGSGKHVRCYVYRTQAGEMYQMPLAWYSQEKKWRMNPGFDNAQHAGFQRKITRECMFCHNAFPSSQPGTDAYWQPHLFPEQLPHGIGCQRCHGPGEQHVRLAESEAASKDAILAAVVNPSKLDALRRDDVCNQCHLQPSSQILSQQVQIGRGEYSFRPGESLREFRAMLDAQLPTGQTATALGERFEINHHPYRLRQSRCFTQSDPGELSCTSCHDPHRIMPPTERVAHYQSVCLSCHTLPQCTTAEAQWTATESQRADNASEASVALPAGPAVDCAGCHMPQRRSQDVVHGIMTDHKIVAQPEPAQQRVAAINELPAVRDELKSFPYFADQPATASMELCQAIADSQTGSEPALNKLMDLVRVTRTTDVQPLAELSRVLRDRGAVEQELDVLLKLVQNHPNNVQAHLEMGMALAAIEQHEQALVYYQRALSIGPALPETHLGIGVSMLHRQDVQQAIQHFREAVRLRPLYPEALLNLGIALHSLRQWSEARQVLQKALAADPTFVEAEPYLNSIPLPK